MTTVKKGRKQEEQRAPYYPDIKSEAHKIDIL
jgi:hypothetical protein